MIDNKGGGSRPSYSINELNVGYELEEEDFGHNDRCITSEWVYLFEREI